MWRGRYCLANGVESLPVDGTTLDRFCAYEATYGHRNVTLKERKELA